MKSPALLRTCQRVARIRRRRRISKGYKIVTTWSRACFCCERVARRVWRTELCMVGDRWAGRGRWRWRSTSVEGRDEDDFVAFLQDIVELAFEFPICRVDQDEDARSSGRAGRKPPERAASAHARKKERRAKERERHTLSLPARTTLACPYPRVQTRATTRSRTGHPSPAHPPQYYSPRSVAVDSLAWL